MTRRIGTLAAVALVLAPLVGIAVAIAAAVAAAAASAIATRARRRRTEASVRRAVPAALDLLVLATEAGLTPHQSVELISRSGPSPARPAFAAVARSASRGISLADALTELPRRLGPQAVAATDALVMAQRHGSPLRDALSVITAEAARQRRVAGEAAARRLPVLLAFPLVCCILPAFTLVAIAPAVLAALQSLRTSGW